MFKLVIQDDEGKTTVVPLIRDEITIGRKEGNTIRLTERNVSRRHARIVRANGAVAIEDLGSYNGVRVNGTRIAQRTALTVSDRVQIGDYLIELKAEGAEHVDYGDQKTQPIERVEAAMIAQAQAMGAAPIAGAGGTVPGVPPPPGVLAAQGMVSGPGSSGAMAMGGLPGAVALADTDPGVPRPAATAATAPMPMPSGHARLVVLSSNFAGREFELGKQQVVIGRTDDNDVVVNHRSISRNHAKIVREADTGRYTISDLQSSNGVRVNGEEYGKVELRRGDIIDLGHVRLRFIEPGEDFVFGRDAHVVDVPTGGSNKGLVIALLALLVVGGAVGVFLAVGGGGETPEVAAGSDEPSATEPVATEPVAVPPVAVADAAVDVEPAIAANPEVVKAVEEATTAMAEEKWTVAASAAKRALELEPTSSPAKDLAEQSKRELANELVYRDFGEAVKAKDPARVATTFGKIDPDSIYKDKARELHDRIKADYVAKQTQQAKLLVKQNKCKDLRKLAEQAGRVWAEAGEAVLAQQCQEATVAAPPRPEPRPDRTPPKPETPKPEPAVKPDKPDKPEPGPAPEVNLEELVSEAEAAARTGQYGKALRLCEDALRQDKSNVRATTACAIASCNLKLGSKAKTYIGRLAVQPARQSAMRQICLRNGVAID
jgi:ABC transport system ATP-binding/permease protein